MSRLWIFVLSLAFAGNLTAQGTVVVPDPPLDAERAALRDAILVFRDSLNSIDAAAGRLQRDYRQASTAALLSRARGMRDACARSARTLPPTRDAVLAANASNAVRQKRRGELLKALDQLRTTLDRCQSDFAAMSLSGQAEKVRGYGNDKAVRVQTELRSYARAAGAFLAAMGIKVTPLGADPRALAG